MSLVMDWLGTDLAERVGLCLVHFLWQGTVLALVTAACLAVTRRLTAATRYAMLLSLFALMAVAPVLTFVTLARRAPLPAIAKLQTSADLQTTEPRLASALPFSPPEHSAPAPAAPPTTDSRPASAVQPNNALAPDNAAGIFRLQPQHLLLFASVWLLGVSLGSLRLMLAMLGAWRVRHVGLTAVEPMVIEIAGQLAQRLGLRSGVRICQSALVAVPTVVGWLHPLVLLPASALSGIPTGQLRALLAHELAHIRRWDYPLNVLQTVVETLLFYHPAVWWLSARIRSEREICCDALAIRATDDRLEYARALAALASSSRLALGVAANGGNLPLRLRIILGLPNRTSRWQRVQSTSAVALSLVSLGLLLLVSWAQADEPQPAAQPSQPVAQPSAKSSPPADSPAQPKAKEIRSALQQIADEEPIYGDDDNTGKLPWIKSPIKGRDYTFRVLNAAQEPVADAVVTSWAAGFNWGGSMMLPKELFPTLRTDAQGAVTVRWPGSDSPLGQYVRGLTRLALRIDHPQHPMWSEYISLNPRQQPPIVLSDAATIEVRIAGKTAPNSDALYPAISPPDAATIEWTSHHGPMTISEWMANRQPQLVLKRVNLTGEHPVGWLRVVHAPKDGTVQFSPLIDLKGKTGTPLRIETQLQPAMRLGGKLSAEVPRPIHNGRVIARIAHGPEHDTCWRWSATVNVEPDGTFVFEALPPDEDLQMIALCDGWASTSPAGSTAGILTPQVVKLDRPLVETELAMQPTARCEITVVNSIGQPLADALVTFSPNQSWTAIGSQLLGEREDTLANVRAQLVSGDHQKFVSYDEPKTLVTKTDARGLATVEGLPANSTDAQREIRYSVQHPNYALPMRPSMAMQMQELGIKIAPGQTSRATIKLYRTQATAPALP